MDLILVRPARPERKESPNHMAARSGTGSRVSTAIAIDETSRLADSAPPTGMRQKG